MSEPIEIIDSWASAIRRHERLVLEVPRAHGATTFLLETLKYGLGNCMVLAPTERKAEIRRRHGGYHAHRIQCITVPPPKGMSRLDLLMVDQPVFFSDPSRPPGFAAVKDGWRRWSETHPKRVVVTATVTQFNVATLAELFPPADYHRIRFAYTEDLVGQIQDDGRVAPFTSELWTEEKLVKRREEIGRRQFGFGFQVIGAPPARLCEHCNRELEPVEVTSDLKVDTAVLYADNLWAIDAMCCDLTKAWGCRHTCGDPVPIDSTPEALEEWAAAHNEAGRRRNGRG